MNLNRRHYKAELFVPLNEIASNFKPDHVPDDAKVFGRPREVGQRDPELTGVTLVWSWVDE